jgi:predicted ArsR family transcriptional regulator
MPGPKPESQPRFSRKEIRQAEKIARRRSAPHKYVWRARLALALSKEPTLRSPEAARRLGVHAQTVRRWRQRWVAEGFSVEDKPHPGRPPSFSPSRRGAGEGDRV